MRILIILSVFLLVSSCNNESPRLYLHQGNAFGTTYSVQYFNNSELDIETGFDSIFYNINKSVSTYMYESDISKINRGDSTVIIDDIFLDVFQMSETVYANSKGYFDPTVGGLRNAYGFGEEKPLSKISSEQLDSLRNYVGFHKVNISNDRRVQKLHPQIYIDFNAIAKGYGIDRLGDYLMSLGIENFIIELGGELLARGKNIEKDQFWTVGIETPNSQLEQRSYQASVQLIDKGMASSGNYRKFRVDSLTGVKFVHTINPLSGKAEQTDVTSATVIAPTCALADAYATAFMAMGFERSKELIDKLSDIEVYLTYIDEVNSEQVFISEGMQEFLID